MIPAGAGLLGCAVAIYRLLQNAVFGPEDVQRVALAYELTLKVLKLTDRNDPMTEMVANHIIEIAHTGEMNPERICAQAIVRISNRYSA